MKKLLLLSLLAITLFASSCTKEDPTPTPVVKSKTELLMHNGAAWKLTKATVDPALPAGGTLITDYYGQMKACEKDDTYLYSANPITATTGSVILQNPVKCESTEIAQYAGTWSLNSDGTLTSDFISWSTNVELIELSDVRLITKEKIPYGGINYYVTWTYQ